MTVHQPPQFTPAQILDAARRAEVEGQPDFAHQFYRHLLDYFPGTAEAAIAAQSIPRLPRNGAPTRPPEATNGSWQPMLQLPPLDPQPKHNVDAGILPDAPQLQLPPPVSDYRTGRALARLIVWLGGIQILAGLCLLPISMLTPRTLSGIPLISLVPTEPGFAARLMFAGIVQILFGQLARAVFDHANAARDLATLTRANAAPRRQAAHTPEGRGRQRR